MVVTGGEEIIGGVDEIVCGDKEIIGGPEMVICGGMVVTCETFEEPIEINGNEDAFNIGEVRDGLNGI